MIRNVSVIGLGSAVLFMMLGVGMSVAVLSPRIIVMVCMFLCAIAVGTIILVVCLKIPTSTMMWQDKNVQVEQLITDLKTHPNWTSREKAAKALGNMQDSKATAALIQALGDVVWEVQLSAAEALGTRRDVSAIEALINTLGNAHRPVRNAVVAALERIGTPAVEPLLQALGTKNLDRREGVIVALGKIGDTQAIAPLTCLLTQEKSWAVKNKVVWALEEITDGRSEHPLPLSEKF